MHYPIHVEPPRTNLLNPSNFPWFQKNLGGYFRNNEELEAAFMLYQDLYFTTIARCIICIYLKAAARGQASDAFRELALVAKIYNFRNIFPPALTVQCMGRYHDESATDILKRHICRPILGMPLAD